MEISIAKIIKDNKVYFDFYREEKLYYYLIYEENKYRFPVPINDTGNGVFNPIDKAVVFMRWIRKAIENEEMYIEKLK